MSASMDLVLNANSDVVRLDGRYKEASFDAANAVVLSVAFKSSAGVYSVEAMSISTNLNYRFFIPCTNTIAGIKEKSLLEFDLGYTPDKHEIPVVDVASVPKLGAVLEMILDHGKQGPFVLIEERLKSLSFYSVTITDPISFDKVVFIRSFARKLEFGRKGIFRLCMQNGQYNVVSEKNLMFDEKHDVVIINNRAMILNQHNFCTLFGFSANEDTRLKSSMTAINTLCNIQNIDDFEAFCRKNFHAMAKVINITGSSKFGSLTLQGLLETIRTHSVDVKLWQDKSGVDCGFVFDPHPMRAWKIIELLDDQHLSSDMTKQKYRANSKTVTA